MLIWRGEASKERDRTKQSKGRSIQRGLTKHNNPRREKIKQENQLRESK